MARLSPSPTTLTRSLLTALALLLAMATLPATAQKYPDKPVRIIVPFPAGGGTDIIGRLLGQKLTENLGQSFVVDNRPGAGGTLGAEAAARSTPDGYTLLVVSASYSVSPSLYKLGYDPLADLAPIAMLASVPFVLVTYPTYDAGTVAQVIAAAKGKPGEINFASSGNGSAPHLAGEMLAQATGVKLVHVPFKGGAPAITEVVAGRVQLYFSTVTQALPFIKAGKLKPIAVSSRKRSPSLPDVPTLEEAGVPNFDIVDWFGVLAPRATPATTLERLSAEIIRAANQPDLKERLNKEGFDVIASTPEEFDRRLRSDIDMYGRVVKSAGVKVE